MRTAVLCSGSRPGPWGDEPARLFPSGTPSRLSLSPTRDEWVGCPQLDRWPLASAPVPGPSPPSYPLSPSPLCQFLPWLSRGQRAPSVPHPCCRPLPTPSLSSGFSSGCAEALPAGRVGAGREGAGRRGIHSSAWTESPSIGLRDTGPRACGGGGQAPLGVLGLGGVTSQLLEGLLGAFTCGPQTLSESLPNCT